MSELRGNADASTPMDAGSDVAQSQDAGSDGPPPSDADADADADAGTGPDATADATPDAVLSPCAVGTHAFCVDFDDGVLAQHFSKLNIPATGALAIVDDHAVSMPSSLRVALPARGVNPTGVVFSTAERSFSGPWSATRVTNPAWGAGDMGFAVAAMIYGSDTGQLGVYLNVAKGETVMDLDGELSATGASITYGSVLTEFPHPMGSPGANPYTLLLIGLMSPTGPSPAIDVRYDNVVVDFL
jgi:hypothetical protein